MRLKQLIWILSLLFLVAFNHSWANREGGNKLSIYVFYGRDCEDCRQIMTDFFPQIESIYGDRLQVRYFEVNDPANYQVLVRLEEAYKKALAKLERLGKKSYQDIIKKMLLKVAKSGPGEVIISREDRKRITPSFLKSINKELMISKEEREISGGFILKRKKIEINNSFESLLRSKREELESRLVRILFK